MATTEQTIRRINSKVAANVKEFNSLIQEWAKTVPIGSVIDLQRKMALEAIQRLIKKTPVDSGRARGGWQTAIGPGNNTDNGIFDKSGGSAIQETEKVVNQLGSQFVLLTIFNNVPYITFLEDGSSSQAPRGMVRLTIQELKQAFT
jgi:hypothetical protein